MRFSADTNVFAYLADDREPQNQAIARELVEVLLSRETWVGLQVVGELQNVLRRRFKKVAVEAAGVASFVLTSFPTFAYDDHDVEHGLRRLQAGRLSYWDALLVSACGRNGCQVLFTEDMQDGAVIDGVRIINRFKSADGVLSPAAREALGL